MFNSLAALLRSCDVFDSTTRLRNKATTWTDLWCADLDVTDQEPRSVDIDQCKKKVRIPPRLFAVIGLRRKTHLMRRVRIHAILADHLSK